MIDVHRDWGFLIFNFIETRSTTVHLTILKGHTNCMVWHAISHSPDMQASTLQLDMHISPPQCVWWRAQQRLWWRALQRVWWRALQRVWWRVRHRAAFISALRREHALQAAHHHARRRPRARRRVQAHGAQAVQVRRNARAGHRRQQVHADTARWRRTAAQRRTWLVCAVFRHGGASALGRRRAWGQFLRRRLQRQTPCQHLAHEDAKRVHVDAVGDMCAAYQRLWGHVQRRARGRRGGRARVRRLVVDARQPKV
mmetsp:Transcript_29766/g.88106  ORF Transcript_29766/g.88106 Transcript_29766/m.88106 type:complete len:255 (+) Transcript_29766:1041-1805(+)